MSHHSHSHHMMAFHWNTDVGEFLFPGLDITGVPALIGLCLVLIVISVIYEAVKVFQTKSKSRTARERITSLSAGTTETTNLLLVERRPSEVNPSNSRKLIAILGQASIFLFQNITSYMLMLAVMVYNVYVFASIVLGMGLGYFLFGHISMKVNMENIRARTTNVLCADRSLPDGSASISGQQGNEQVDIDGNPCSSTSYHNQAVTQERIATIESEVEIHPCTDAHDTENHHTCRL